jgi:primosomal replication protein N
LAVNVVLVLPVPIVTDAGTVTAALPLDRLTLVGLVAALVKLTVQVELPGGVNVPGVQLSPDSTGTGAFSVRVAVFDVPFQLAVSSAEPLALTAAAALAVNVALDAPVPIVTDAGTVTAALPLDRFTLVGLVVTFVRLTVHVELAGGVSVLGVHVRLESKGGAGASSVKVAVFDVPFQLAVSNAEPLALTAAAALAVNVVLVVPVPIVTDAGTVTAALPLDRLTLVGLVAALVRLTVQVELAGGVNVPGEQLRLESTGIGALSVKVAVLDVPFQLAVSNAEPLALTAAAALAVNVVLDAPVPIVTDAGTVTAAFPLDRFTLVGLVAALVRLTVQVELPGGVNVPGVQLRLESTGIGASRVRVAVLDVPFQLAVINAEPLALTAAAALAVNVALVAPVPIVTDAGTVTAAFPLDRLTLVGLVAALVRLTVQVELPGGVNVPGAQLRFDSTGIGASSVRVAVFELPLNTAVKSAEVLAPTAAGALAVNVALVTPVPIVTDAGTLAAGLPLDKLTLAGLDAGFVRLTVQVELPGGVNVLGTHARLESTGAGGFRVSVAVCELPLNVAVKTAEAVALTAAAALAVNVALLAPVPTVTDAGTVTAGFPLDKLTLMGLVAAPVRLTVQVELPGGVSVLGAHIKPESVGGGNG